MGGGRISTHRSSGNFPDRGQPGCFGTELDDLVKELVRLARQVI